MKRSKPKLYGLSGLDDQIIIFVIKMKEIINEIAKYLRDAL